MIINRKPHQTGFNKNIWTRSNLGKETPSFIPGHDIFKFILGVNSVFNFSFIV